MSAYQTTMCGLEEYDWYENQIQAKMLVKLDPRQKSRVRYVEIDGTLGEEGKSRRAIMAHPVPDPRMAT